MRNITASQALKYLEQRVSRLEKQSRQYIPSEQEAIDEYLPSYEGWKVLKKGEISIYLDDVWEMYVKTYKKIGLTISNAQGLLKYDTWYVHFEGGEPNAFNLFTKTSFGLKSGLSGSDMASGKRVSKSWIQTRWKSVPNFYGEVSGAVEAISIKSGVPVICAAHVEKILGKPTNGYDEDNVHYLRNFGGHLHTKIMIGNPRGVKGMPYSKALVSCPLPQAGMKLARHEKTSAFEDRVAQDCSIYENSLFR